MSEEDKDEKVIGNDTIECESRKHYCECEGKENKHEEGCFEEAIKEMYCKNNPGLCNPCTCPPGSCTCPAGSCTCPPGSCTCPIGSCTCPPGSCTCPEGTCPQTIELVQNPSFETPCTAPPPCNVFQFWTGTNLASSSDALTGIVAAELGFNNQAPSTLEQTICGINPGCPYEFSFSVSTQNQSSTAQFTAQVNWQQGPIPNPVTDTPAFTPIVINGSGSGNDYVFIKRITSIAPAGTTCARILFTKSGTGSVQIDDVSFSG